MDRTHHYTSLWLEGDDSLLRDDKHLVAVRMALFCMADGQVESLECTEGCHPILVHLIGSHAVHMVGDKADRKYLYSDNSEDSHRSGIIYLCDVFQQSQNHA